MTDIAQWSSAWSVPPGEILVEALEERGMTQAELSRRMARPLKTISEIATAKASITPDTAIQLERALGISAATWLGLESRYREARARERDLADLENHVSWLSKFPMKTLTSHGIVTPRSAGAQQAAELLGFFGVSNPAGWEQYWGQIAASYRMSDQGTVSPYSVALWLRVAELETEGIGLPAYEPARLRGVAHKIRPLSREVVLGGALERARDLLQSSGVGLVLILGVPGAPASGAVHWIRANPWIVLTPRYMTDDQLWFSLFHEIGHLVDDGRRQGVVEEIRGGELPREDEQAANLFARETLVPQGELDRWLRENVISRETIIDFARNQSVSSGVVVGRMQRDAVIERTQFNGLKRRWRVPNR